MGKMSSNLSKERLFVMESPKITLTKTSLLEPTLFIAVEY
jgi:hypothetical protein